MITSQKMVFGTNIEHTEAFRNLHIISPEKMVLETIQYCSSRHHTLGLVLVSQAHQKRLSYVTSPHDQTTKDTNIACHHTLEAVAC